MDDEDLSMTIKLEAWVAIASLSTMFFSLHAYVYVMWYAFRGTNVLNLSEFA